MQLTEIKQGCNIFERQPHLRAVISTWTLFFGLLLIAAGNGLQVVLLGTRAPEVGFSNIATGIVMSGYFAGIFAGSLIVPNILARVGHVRVFGAMSAIASAAVLIHIVLLDPSAWTVMRLPGLVSLVCILFVKTG